MVSNLEDVERLFDAVKRLRTERRRMDTMGKKAQAADLSKTQKWSADLNEQALHIRKIESEVHAIAVDCGFADLREPAHYRPRTAKVSAFHEHEFVPALPRGVEAPVT